MSNDLLQVLWGHEDRKQTASKTFAQNGHYSDISAEYNSFGNWLKICIRNRMVNSTCDKKYSTAKTDTWEKKFSMSGLKMTFVHWKFKNICFIASQGTTLKIYYICFNKFLATLKAFVLLQTTNRTKFIAISKAAMFASAINLQR